MIGAVGDGYLLDAGPGQRPAGKLPGVARSDNHHAAPAQVSKGLPGQFDAGPADGQGVAAYFRFPTHLAANPESPLEQVGKGLRQGVQQAGGIEGLPHLADDLLLAQDHRVQAGCDPEQVAYALPAPVHVQEPVEVLKRYVEAVGQEPLDALLAGPAPVGRPVAIHRLHGVELRAVAGAEDDTRNAVFRHGLQGLGQLGLGQ